MPGLNAVGELSYAGIQFDGSSKVKVDVEFVKDDAKRTTIYQKMTINVEGVIANGGTTTDLTMQQIRTLLGEQGRLLSFTNRGFGTDIVVGPGAIPDIKFGPSPEVLMWEPIGSNMAAEIRWRCVVCAQICDTPPRTSGIMALNYGIDFRIDKHGDTTRTINGYLEIVNSRRGKAIADTADNYLDKFICDTLPGFERTTSRSLSPDRSRLNFTITDTQISSRNPYPQHVTQISGDAEVGWSLGRNGAVIPCSINMEITPKSNVSPAYAHALFLDAVKLRTNRARGAGKGVLIQSVNIREDLFGRACKFGIRYTVLACLPDLMTATGIFEPLGTDWSKWKTSLADVNGYYGTSGLKGGPDVIVDLCGSEQLPQETVIASLPTMADEYRPTLANVLPPASHSYAHYENHVVPITDTPVVRQQVLQEYEPSTSDVAEPTSILPFSFPSLPNIISDILQVGGAPSYGVGLVGQAVRVGYPVPRPAITQYGNSTIREVGGTFVNSIVGNALGVSVYRAVWNLWYASNKSPGTVEPPKNPKDCVESNGSAHKPQA